MRGQRNSLHCLIPPYILDALSKAEDPAVRKLAIDAIEASATARAVRATLSTFPQMAAIPSPERGKHRLIYDLEGRDFNALPGKLVRSEGQKRIKDPAVNEAYDHSGATYDFYREVFKRNSLDDKGMSLISSVHLLKRMNNAFWNGEQMVYGDGDGKEFIRFTRALDVVGHELSHGVIAHTCRLDYQNESGALNEHFADVFGVMVKQWKKGQTAAQADWLIGAGIMGPVTKAKSLRTFKAGKAYEDDPLLGTDPQPKHLSDKYKGSADNGGVHINSGIPNHAFYLAAMKIGGRSWLRAGRIWYRAMLSLTENSGFKDMVKTTVAVAATEFGRNSKEHKAVKAAWKAVGL
jgi:Zn-dependent metalloprotease